MPKLPADLSASLNKNIDEICTFSISKNANQNHCAHYVSHMLGYELGGPTCKNFTWEDRQKPDRGATLRVDDLFNQSSETGLLADKPATLTDCLVFVTLTSNVRKQGARLIMGDNSRKHVGILTQGSVWNYSNGRDKVTSDQLDAFKMKFTQSYKKAGDTVEFYFGRLL